MNEDSDQVKGIIYAIDPAAMDINIKYKFEQTTPKFTHLPKHLPPSMESSEV